MRIRYFLPSLIAALCLFCPLRSQAREDDGQIRGTVSDSTDAVIPKARIELLKSGKRIQFVESNGEGSFIFSNLPTGKYAVIASANGFDKYKEGNIRVSPNEARTLKIVLKVAAVSENVEVNGHDEQDNGFGSILRGSRIDDLPDDPSQLQSVLDFWAAQSGGPGTPQIYIDGFPATTLPPKDLIQEIRVNQDPYSAKYSDAGGPRIEIVTKSGTEKVQGSAQMDATSSALNTKNHFVQSEPSYYSLKPAATLGGPFNKWASYFMAGQYDETEQNAIINADVLSAQFNAVTLDEAVAAPTASMFLYTRIDLHSANSNTLGFSYNLQKTASPDGSVGGLSLPSQALKTSADDKTIEVFGRETLGKNVVNQFGLQYHWTSSQEQPIDTGPTITVAGAFVDGGNNAGTSKNANRILEIKEGLTLGHTSHVIDLGGSLSAKSTDNTSTSGFNGNFTFSSLGAYQITEQGLANQLSLQEVQAEGGGASQFSITTGHPSIAGSIVDFAAYVQDQWKLREGLQVDLGLRCEQESGKYGRGDFLPRVGFNYGIKHRKAAIGQTQMTGGLQWSAKHFGLANVEQLERFNGTTQQQYLVNLPDFFPMFPPVNTLSPGPQSPLTTDTVSSRYRDSYSVTASAGISQPVLKSTSVTVNYQAVRNLDQLIAQNINTPLPGTYDPSNPSSGIRPYGNDVNIFQFDPEGITKDWNLYFAVNIRAGTRLSITAGWSVDEGKSDSGPGTPSNPFDLKADYGRTGPRTAAGIMGVVSLPFHIIATLRTGVSSSQPFNIVVGQDLNGDTLFNDRPSFATDLSRPSVVYTKWGVFDTSPIPGQTIIPINYGSGPSKFNDSLYLKKSFNWGSKTQQKAGVTSQVPSPERKSWLPPGPFRVDMSAGAQNVFNIDSLGPPNGTLGSPLFGKSISGGNGRTVYLHTGMSF